MIRVSPRRSSSLLVLAVAAGLAGCNSTAEPMAAAEPAAMAQPAGAPVAAAEIPLPPGAACTGAIGRWRAVIEHDYQTGYVDPPVYAAAEREIAQAQNVCAAGRDAQAVQLVAESRRRHGYPPDSP